MPTRPLVVLAWLALLASPAYVVAEGEVVAAEGADVAEPEAPADSAPEATPETGAPSLGLDRLLRPRGTLPPQTLGFGARNRQEWVDAFEQARLEVDVLESRIEVAQEKLRQASSGNWSYSPTGGEASDPEVLRLRAELRRDRQSLETARRRLRDLDVEASLAGVPQSWREPLEP